MRCGDRERERECAFDNVYSDSLCMYIHTRAYKGREKGESNDVLTIKAYNV